MTLVARFHPASLLKGWSRVGDARNEAPIDRVMNGDTRLVNFLAIYP